jgi:hypothetical protein
MMAALVATSIRFAARDAENRATIESVKLNASLAAARGQRLVISNGHEFIMFYCVLEPSLRKSLTLVDLMGERHAILYEKLNDWIARKGMAAFDRHDAEWLNNETRSYYIYKNSI